MKKGFVRFGDICVFKENNTKSYLTCPLTSTHHANLVVPDGKGNGGGVPGASFQTCQFQIVAEEKSKWSAKVAFPSQHFPSALVAPRVHFAPQGDVILSDGCVFPRIVLALALSIHVLLSYFSFFSFLL